MLIDPRQTSQVLTGALGKFTVQDLKQPATTVFPTLREISAGKDRRPPPQNYSNKHGGRRGDSKFRPRKSGTRKPFFKKKSHGTHEATHDDSESNAGFQRSAPPKKAVSTQRLTTRMRVRLLKLKKTKKVTTLQCLLSSRKLG